MQLVLPLFSDRPYRESLSVVGLTISIVVAGLLVLLFFKVVGPPEHLRPEFQSAPLAIGTLVSSRATGSSVNDQPQVELVLDVETATGDTFRGTARTIVNQAELAQLSPGRTFAVRHLESGRLAVDPDASAEELQQSLYASRVARGLLTPQQVEVATRGTDATAVVMQMRPTGEISHGHAVLHLELRVTRLDGTTFDAVRDMPIPSASVGELQTGKLVEVRYLPSDESYVAVSTRV